MGSAVVNDSIYLDYAATAPLHPAASRAVQAGQSLVGNPSSAHGAGRAAAAALQDARRSIASMLGTSPGEIVLTSGGSESNTLALWGTFAARRFSGHLVTTSIEHSSILENASALAELGVSVTFVDPQPSGHVDAGDVGAAMRPDTALVSVMHANNETGAVQPIALIAAATRAAGVPFHTDAVHTAGKLDIAAVGAEMISVSAHKFGGPRGVGALAVRTGNRLAPVIRGGSQEDGQRAGTENVAGVMGMAAAADVCRDRISGAYRAHVHNLRNRLIAGLYGIGGVHINATDPIVAETIGVRFDGIRADTLADALDLQDIYVSTGSACHARKDRKNRVSHVLTAQGLTEEQSRSAVRFSLGSDVTAEDIDRVVSATCAAVDRLRRTAGRQAVLQ
ncbi:MAG: cysteine desulfurase [Mycobacterium sp.]|nr:cysteine desulfurase [Mycobacterium sp.]